MKTKNQSCIKVDLVYSLKKIESNILTQAVDSNINFSNSLATHFEQLAVASKSTQEIISKLASYQLQKQDKPKKSFNKLPVDYKRMLLIASGEGQVVLEELNDEAMAFFVLPNSKVAHINLNSPLESEKVRGSVSPAIADHLFVASFRWSNMIRPSGLASLVLTIESYPRTDVLNEAMVLDLSTRFEISDEYISKLTVTKNNFP